MDLAMGLGNPDPDLGGVVPHAWVHLTKEIVFGGSVMIPKITKERFRTKQPAQPQKVKKFETNTPMGRAGQPDEVAPCYVFLSCDDSSYMSGQVLHPNGGRIVNG